MTAVIVALVVAGVLGSGWALTALRLSGEKAKRAKLETEVAKLLEATDELGDRLANVEADHAEDERDAAAVIASLRGALAKANDTIRSSRIPGSALERLRLLSSETTADRPSDEDG